MTVFGILFILVGLFVGLTGGTPFNGQWLIGLMLAMIGWVLVALDRKNQ